MTAPVADTKLAPRLPGLDGLRALAIGLVIASHVRQSPGFPRLEWVERLAAGGAYGVTLFFTLSGFLITKLLLDEERRTGAISLPRFYARRSLRILPPAFAYLALAAVYGAWAGHPLLPVDLASCVFFFRNHVDGPLLTDQFWSLGIEEQYYLGFPLLLQALPARLRLRAFVLACVAAPAWRLLNDLSFSQVNWWRADLRYDALLWGAVLALVIDSPRWRPAWSRVSRSGPWLLPVALVLLTLSNVLPLAVPKWVLQLTVSGQLLLNALVIGLLVDGQGGGLGRLFELRWARWLGVLSYSLYLWQQPFCWVRFGYGWEAFPLNLGLSVGAAWLSLRWIERPALALRRRWLERAPGAPRPELTVG